jgi:transposase
LSVFIEFKDSNRFCKKSGKNGSRQLSLPKLKAAPMSLIFCGIDFHKNTSTICYIFPDGKEEIKTVRTSNLIAELSNKPLMKVAVEATGGSNHLAEQIMALGHDLVLIDTVKFKAIGIGGKKTDEKDAKALAHILKVDYVPKVFVKSLGARRLKSLLVTRELCVTDRVQVTNHIRGILREYGLTMPQGVDEFNANVSQRIAELNFPFLEDNLRFHLRKSVELKSREKEIDNQIALLISDDPRSSILQSVPGVGPMCAAAFIAVIDDITRFKNSKELASYVGLVPRETSSGGKRRLGSITQAGSEMLRRYFIHGARSVLMHTNDKSKEPLRVWALKIKKKSGMNKATVALAHRMMRVCFCLIKENRKYVKVHEIGIEKIA